jgi:hypothetical protein
VSNRRARATIGGSFASDDQVVVSGMRLRVVTAMVAAVLLAPCCALAATDPRYNVPPGFTRCPRAQAEGGFFKWASVERATCGAAADFMAAYAVRAASAPAMPHRVRGYRCAIRYWRNRDGDIYASRHACRRGRLAIRFYAMS